MGCTREADDHEIIEALVRLQFMTAADLKRMICGSDPIECLEFDKRIVVLPELSLRTDAAIQFPLFHRDYSAASLPIEI